MEELYSFTMLPSYYIACRDLPDAQRLAMYDAILSYGHTGILPQFDDPMVRMGFQLIQPVLESSVKYHISRRKNGRCGGRPRKNEASAKTTEKPSENHSESCGKHESECECESEHEGEHICAAAGGAAPAQRKNAKRHEFGQYGWVKLSDEEYHSLINDLGQAEAERCIAYVDELAQSNGNKNRWRDWNLVVRKCARDRWGAEKKSDRNGQFQRHGEDLSPMARRAVAWALEEGGSA